ncbi:MAG: M16 family metallopeptidase [Bacteriovoracaceae bacterium]
MKFILSILLLCSFTKIQASEHIDVEKFNWDGMDVVYLQDERLPTYLVQFFFADGALADRPTKGGETEMMFELLSRGTDQYDQKKLADFFEFYGVEFSSQTVHEYSTFAYSGLVKDIQETTKMVCHMFTNATYPKEEISKYQVLISNQWKNLVINHGALAERVFRQVSLANTPYASATDGSSKTLLNITNEDLKAKNHYFNHSVKKRIYLTGPKKMLDGFKETLSTNCGWQNSQQAIVRGSPDDKNYVMLKKPMFYLVPVPKANQAQIKIGRYVTSSEVSNSDFNKQEYLGLVSEFLGGGFTSKLMQELRVKRGLTYSAGSTISLQKYYGRIVISTFTKNETLKETLNVTKNVLVDVAQSNFDEKEVATIIQNLSGSHPFKFEANKSFMQNLAFFDHIGKSYNDLYEFPNIIKKIKKQDIARITQDAFNWNQQIILVVGDKALESQLKELGEVQILNYKDYL